VICLSKGNPAAAQLCRYADQRVKCDRSDCSDRRSCRVRSLMQFLPVQRSILGNAPCTLIEAVSLSGMTKARPSSTLILSGKGRAIMNGEPDWSEKIDQYLSGETIDH